MAIQNSIRPWISVVATLFAVNAQLTAQPEKDPLDKAGDLLRGLKAAPAQGLEVNPLATVVDLTPSTWIKYQRRTENGIIFYVLVLEKDRRMLFGEFEFDGTPSLNDIAAPKRQWSAAENYLSNWDQKGKVVTWTFTEQRTFFIREYRFKGEVIGGTLVGTLDAKTWAHVNGGVKGDLRDSYSVGTVKFERIPK